MTAPSSAIPSPAFELSFLTSEIRDALRRWDFHTSAFFEKEYEEADFDRLPHAHAMLDEARRAGEALIIAETAVSPRNWRSWLDENFGRLGRYADQLKTGARAPLKASFEDRLNEYMEGTTERRCA